MLVILGARDVVGVGMWRGCFPLGPDVVNINGTGGMVEHVSGLPVHGLEKGAILCECSSLRFASS